MSEIDKNIREALDVLRWVQTDMAYKAPEQAAECVTTWEWMIRKAMRLLEELGAS